MPRLLMMGAQAAVSLRISSPNFGPSTIQTARPCFCNCALLAGSLKICDVALQLRIGRLELSDHLFQISAHLVHLLTEHTDFALVVPLIPGIEVQRTHPAGNFLKMFDGS